MALIANDASDLVDQLIILTTKLSEICEKQSKMFADNNLDDINSLNEEAGRLAATYALESQRIARNPAILSGANPHLSQTLKETTERFKNIMISHEKNIERGIHIAEGLVRAIAAEAISHRPQPQAYGPNATTTNNIKRDTSAIALDRRA